MEFFGLLFLIIVIYIFYKYLRPAKDTSSPFKPISNTSSVLENKSGIPDEVLEKFFDEVVEEFVQGKNADKFVTNLLLKRNERLIFDVPNILLCEERSVKVKGGYQGFSVRIMKGVSYRFGGFEASSERKIVEIDRGNLILTNKRMVFSGNKLSKDISLAKINTINTLENGIAITRTGKQKTEYYMGTNNVEIKMTITPDRDEPWDEGQVMWYMTGIEVKKIITALLQE